jgi:hypothetical protein
MCLSALWSMRAGDWRAPHQPLGRRYSSRLELIWCQAIQSLENARHQPVAARAVELIGPHQRGRQLGIEILLQYATRAMYLRLDGGRLEKNGAPDRIRTCDLLLLLRRPTLYQLSYGAHAGFEAGPRIEIEAVARPTGFEPFWLRRPTLYPAELRAHAGRRDDNDCGAGRLWNRAAARRRQPGPPDKVTRGPRPGVYFSFASSAWKRGSCRSGS